MIEQNPPSARLKGAAAQQALIAHAADRGVFLPAATFPRYLVVASGPNRAARRAAHSPAVRPPPSTIESRAAAARLRIAALRARQAAQ